MWERENGVEDIECIYYKAEYLTNETWIWSEGVLERKKEGLWEVE